MRKSPCKKDAPPVDSSSRRAWRLVREAPTACLAQVVSCEIGFAAPPAQPDRTGGETPKKVVGGVPEAEFGRRK